MDGLPNRTKPNRSECELFVKMDSNEMEMADEINWQTLKYTLWNAPQFINENKKSTEYRLMSELQFLFKLQ